MRGIGVKTAAELINAFGDLESLLNRLNEIKQPKRRETLTDNAGNARISLKLAQLDHRVPLKTSLDEFAVHDPEPVTLIGFLKAMEFFALGKRAASHYGIDDVDAIPPAAEMRAREVEFAGGIRSAVNSGTSLSWAAATAAMGRMWFSLSMFRRTRWRAVSPEPTRFEAA